MDKRGYRRCVRVIIQKGDKVLICKKFMRGEWVGYEFPGGGIEPGESIKATVVKECLEEVGILVKNVQALGIEFTYELDYPNPERAKLYRGGIDLWQRCVYVRDDKHLFNTEGDGVSSTWVTLNEAVKLINESPKDLVFNPVRLQVLAKIREINERRLEDVITGDW